MDEDSNLMRHAKRELELLGEDADVVEGHLKIVRIFSEMGHSGTSAPLFIAQLTRLLSFENLTDLTNDPEEWMEFTVGKWQNRRKSEAFSEDGGQTYTLNGDPTRSVYETKKVVDAEETKVEPGDVKLKTAKRFLPDASMVIESVWSRKDMVSLGKTGLEILADMIKSSYPIGKDAKKMVSTIVEDADTDSFAFKLEYIY